MKYGAVRKFSRVVEKEIKKKEETSKFKGTTGNKERTGQLKVPSRAYWTPLLFLAPKEKRDFRSRKQSYKKEKLSRNLEEWKSKQRKRNKTAS